jgi:hypothetical protein
MTTNAIAIYSFPFGWKAVLAAAVISGLIWILNRQFGFVSKLTGPRARPILIFLFYLFVVMAFKSPVMNLPYGRGDINGYILPASEWTLNHHFLPPTGDIPKGHPPIWYELLALAFAVTGSTAPWVSHLAVNILAAAGLFFTHLLGRHLADGRTALTGALLLFFSPCYFHTANGPFFGIPLAAFSAMTIYFALRERPALYLISATLMVLCKITGVLILPGILLFVAMKAWRGGLGPARTARRLFLYALPLLAAAGWMIVLRATVDPFPPPYFDFFHVAPITNLKNFFYMLSILFYGNFKWILSFFLLWRVVRDRGAWWRPEFAAFYLMLITAAAFFSFYGYHFHRYLLPVYPPLFLLFGKAVYDTLKHRAWIVLAVTMVILFTKDFYKPQFKTMPFVKKDREKVTGRADRP